jgi:membrane peptidoglycan carboxypeptidase
MQVARSIFFTPERTWRRKLAETMVALQLEQRFSKQQIFQLYANEIYLGNRGSFAIHGFAEGSLAYFNKDIRELALPEAAFLSGIIRAPNRYSSAERRPSGPPRHATASSGRWPTTVSSVPSKPRRPARRCCASCPEGSRIATRPILWT